MDNDAEEQFLARVEKRAQELSKNIRHVFAECGMSRDLKRTPISNRPIETVEKLAKHLRWTLPQIMGWSNRIDVGISALAYDGAGLTLARLPAWARSRGNWIDAHATIYDLLVARRDEGKLSDDMDVRSEILAEYVEFLARAWESRPQPVSSPPSTIAADAWQRRSRPARVPAHG